MVRAKQRNSDLQKEFILPDYKTVKKGFVKDDSDEKQLADIQANNLQSVKMVSDRFTVPEVLFNPSDISESHFIPSDPLKPYVLRIYELLDSTLLQLHKTSHYENVITLKDLENTELNSLGS